VERVVTVERPILFSAPMVRAVLEGSKTVTRRVMTPQPIPMPKSTPRMKPYDDSGHWWVCAKVRSAVSLFDAPCLGPYGYKRDRLWVRETWMPDPPIDDTWASTEWSGCGRRIADVVEHYRKPEFCLYAASWQSSDLNWKPSIHMPRWASRITLEVTGVTVERLQDITEEQAKAEGVTGRAASDTWLCVPKEPEAGPFEVFIEPDESFRKEHGLAFVKHQPGRELLNARQAFSQLWDGINGQRPGCSWADNPWVWAVSFRKLTP
jgi:hypothetical protein